MFDFTNLESHPELYDTQIYKILEELKKELPVSIKKDELIGLGAKYYARKRNIEEQRKKWKKLPDNH